MGEFGGLPLTVISPGRLRLQRHRLPRDGRAELARPTLVAARRAWGDSSMTLLRTIRSSGPCGLALSTLLACGAAEVPPEVPPPTEAAVAEPAPPPAEAASAEPTSPPTPAIPSPRETEAATRWLAGGKAPSSPRAIAVALGAKDEEPAADDEVRGRKIRFLLPTKESSPCFFHRTRETGTKLDVTVRVRKHGCEEGAVPTARAALAKACGEVGGKLEAEAEWSFGPAGVIKDESLSCETGKGATEAAPPGVTFDRAAATEATADRWNVQAPWGAAGKTRKIRIERWTRTSDGQVLWEVSRSDDTAKADEKAFETLVAKIPRDARLKDSKTTWVTGK